MIDWWHLKPKELPRKFTQNAFSDDFAELGLCSEWQWINPRGDCRYQLNSEPFWLEIQAASNCLLLRCKNNNNLNAPRLMQEIWGDFAIETKMASAGQETPTIDGLLIWKDSDNFIRFDKGMLGTNEIGLSGNIDGNWDHFGRGMLISDTIYMRIEKIGDILSAYCSKDGESWLTCGEVSFPVEGPVQAGIHAISYWIATTSRFDYFWVLREKS
ncbi:DUF1349 domain-containing protein [Candidatus Poribacteria bacterium]|nr:DUF1349 domain-containing protein [Candidatus Poribacteria bacterium]